MNKYQLNMDKIGLFIFGDKIIFYYKFKIVSKIKLN